MAGFLASLISDYGAEMERHRNRPFLRAAMAACALAATADGEVSFGERIRVDRILDTLGRLRIFDPHEAVDLFNDFTRDLLERPREGHEAALEAVQRVVRDEPATAPLVARMCLAVAESHGALTPASRAEIATLCRRIGVDPAAAGLTAADAPDAPSGAPSGHPPGNPART